MTLDSPRIRTSSLDATKAQVRFAPLPVVDLAEDIAATESKRSTRFVSIPETKLFASARVAPTVPRGTSIVGRVQAQLDEVKKEFFTGSARAILDYQRDSRYAAVDPQQPAPLSPIKVPKDVPGKRVYFAKCNECEEREGAYTRCEHIDNEPFDTTVNETRVGQRIKPAYNNPKSPYFDILLTQLNLYSDENDLNVDKMINSRNISALLTENVDKHASKYLFVIPFLFSFYSFCSTAFKPPALLPF